ncbi:hypothetical protein [Peribacillus asahii]|uniref:hypothetical protein n=1 Tax=Peribacillus asahii TaxID=228899 RepID=UPI003806D9F9
MSKFINKGRENHREYIVTLLEKVETGGDIEILDLVRTVSQVLSNYHNHIIAPDEYWATTEGIDVLPKLLRLLADGVEEIEDIG